jgi:hypothetical protein
MRQKPSEQLMPRIAVHKPQKMTNLVFEIQYFVFPGLRSLNSW